MTCAGLGTNLVFPLFPAEANVVKGQRGEFYRVCYSCHSSLEELKEFVEYFRPREEGRRRT